MAAQVRSEADHRIVVGVDGSEPSKAALRWALRQGRLTGAVVEAVIAWEFPTAYGYPAPVMDVDLEEIATNQVRAAISEATRGAPPVQVRYLVAEGNAARVLLDASADADLLVVGSRGHGGFVEALLGSTGLGNRPGGRRVKTQPTARHAKPPGRCYFRRLDRDRRGAPQEVAAASHGRIYGRR
jgi:nucleotide-binding universal stress UspA family protein